MGPEREIKTTLAIGGETAFKASISESTRALKLMASELKLNTAEFNLNGASMENLTKRRDILNREIEQEKEHIRALTQAVEDSTKRYGANHENTDKYRESLIKSQTALVSMEKELVDNGAAIDNFGNKTQEAEKKTISWRESLEKLNDGIDSGIKALTPIAAGIAAVGTAAVASAKQIFDMTIETGKFADELLTTSTQTGISVQSLQEWKYAAQFIDTEVETMTGSMAKMIKQMDAARDSTEKSASAQANAQLAISNAMLKYDEAVAKYGESSTQAITAANNVEKAQNSLRAVTEGSSTAFQQLGISVVDTTTGKLRDSQVVFFEAIDALGKVANETERDALAMQIFGKSAQELNPLIQAGSAELQRLGMEAQNAGVVMSDQTVSAFGAFDDSMNVLNSTIAGVKNSFITALLPAMQTIVPIVQDIATRFGDWLRSDGAREALNNLTEKISGVASNLSKNLGPTIDKIISTFETVTNTVGWLIEHFDDLVAVGAVVTGMLTTLKVAQIAVNIAMGANPIGIVIVAITALISAIVLLIKNWDSVKEAISRVWESIKKSVSDGVENIKRAFQAVIDWFGNLVSGIWKIGENIVKGIWDGISGAYQWIKNKISGWVDSVMGWFKDLFGIHSPSRKMRDMIGKPMVQGVAVGIEKNAGLVDDAMKDLMPDASAASVMLDVNRRFNALPGSSTGYANQSVAAGGIDYDRLAAAIAKAMPTKGGDVYLDGKKVGIAAAPYVSEAQAKSYTSLQRSGFRGDLQGGIA